MKIQTDEGMVIKRVVYKTKKVKIVVGRRMDGQYMPRVKSAPPISIPEPQPEKKHVLLKADGTPLTIEDLADITDSSSEESVTKEEPKKEAAPIPAAITQEEVPKDARCPRCKYSIESRAEMLEQLLKDFPPVLRKFIPIAEILSCKERTRFELKLMKKGGKPKPSSKNTYVVDRNRKDTVVELARLELNKLTASNFNTVVGKLKALNVQKVEESKEIANILLDKATSEPTFVKLYAKAVGELRKVLRSKEELSMNIKQTAFYGTLLTRAFGIINEKIKWADPATVIDLKDFPNRFAYEEKIEEMEEKRYKKKAYTMGAVTFISQLYIENIISFNKIGERMDELLKDPHFESVEVICAFITAIGEKLQMSNKEQYVNKVFNHLTAIKNNYEFRIQFLIEATLEKRRKWKKAVSSSTQNRFAFMEVEEIIPEVKEIQEVAPVEDNSKVLSFISSIYSELNDCYEEEDKAMIADSFKRGDKEFGRDNFYNFYLSESISDFKKSKYLIPFFVDYFERTGLLKEEINSLLVNLKSNLKELKRDFPKSVPNYIELICLLKIKKIISTEQFENLKNEEFGLKAKEVITKWNKSEELKGKISEAFEQALINDVLKK